MRIDARSLSLWPHRNERIVHANGQTSLDRYAYLEDLHDPKVQRTIDRFNTEARAYLDNPTRLETRKKYQKELCRVYGAGSIEETQYVGGYKFQWRRDGLEDQAVLIRTDSQTGEEKKVLDPNTLRHNPEIPVALDTAEISPSGKFIAYTYSEDGSEQSSLRIRNIRTEQDLPITIPYVAECDIAWLPDESGFYYTRHKDPGTIPQGEEEYHRDIYFHSVDSRTWPSDLLIFEAQDFGGDTKKDLITPVVSKDGQWLMVIAQHGESSDNMDIYLAKREAVKKARRQDPSGFRKVFSSEISQGQRALRPKIKDGRLFMLTSQDASNYRLVSVDLANFSDETFDLSSPTNWQEIIPENKEGKVLIGYNFLSEETILLHYLKNASSVLEVRNIVTGDTEPISLPNMPSLGSVTSITAGPSEQELLITFESYTTPTTVFTFNTRSHKASSVDHLPIKEDLSDIVVERVDDLDAGVHMFIISPKNIDIDKPALTILTGYGGFDIPKTPIFDRAALAWVKSGGVYAVANLPGGIEFGEEGHKNGMRENKQKVFNGFTAAARWLQTEHGDKKAITTSDHLAAYGRSNGGLLVGATMMQHPELFGAVICQVPLLDIARFPQQAKIGWQWVRELGDPTDPGEIDYILSHSPYQQDVDPNDHFPSVFFLAGKNDRRTPPSHAMKMAKKLQKAFRFSLRRRKKRPIIIATINPHGGHEPGLTKPTSTALEEGVNIFTFLDATIGR